METVTHHTTRAVLSRKLATAIESWTLGEILRTVLLLLLSGLLSAAFFDTEATRALVYAVGVRFSASTRRCVGRAAS